MATAPKKVYAIPNPLVPNIPVIFTDDCVGCNICVDVCRTDVLLPNPEPGGHPIVVYPVECWHCGCCVDDCPAEGAIRFQHPLSQKIGWKRKETGERFRPGMEGNPKSCGKEPYI
jgi:NAD-dependent dihydropyrimidine dehydrogenase PreA subunit